MIIFFLVPVMIMWIRKIDNNVKSMASAMLFYKNTHKVHNNSSIIILHREGMALFSVGIEATTMESRVSQMGRKRK